ncbi:MAG TPA: TIGR00153 family protein [bacterium (Candidatus Stahlbacteria)]|nr:TIGR00153 family protein [Candidatus Stahlbacteria bacterium]
MPRIPIIRAIRRSPFDGLLEHANKVIECIKVLKEAVEYYCEGKYERAEELAKKVSTIEHEADIIKGNIRAHLPRDILMPVDKSEFQMLLREQDGILDFAEDVVIWMNMRKTRIPEEIKDSFLDHLYKVIECVEALEQVILHVKELVSAALSRNLRNRTKDAIKNVHAKEWEADAIERSVAKKIFDLNLDATSTFHLLKIVDLIGNIANRAENAGDRIRVMIAR